MENNRPQIVNKVNGRKFNENFHHIEKCRWCGIDIIVYNYHPIFACCAKHKFLYMKRDEIGWFNKNVQSIGGKAGAAVCKKLRAGSYYNKKIHTSVAILGGLANRGIKRTDIAKQNISNSLIGMKASEESKKNMRIARLNYIKNTVGYTSPNIGANEKNILDNLQSRLGFSIKRQFFINGYYLDGYCQELNLAVEVYEDYHYTRKEMALRDKIRQRNIIRALNCKFLVIRESEYLNKLTRANEIKN